jgi:putative transposase
MSLAGLVLIEQHNEWETAESRYFPEGWMLDLVTMNNRATVIEEAVSLPKLQPHKLSGSRLATYRGTRKSDIENR